MQSVDAGLDQEAAAVTFRFKGTPEVRSFREDHSLVIDIGTMAAVPPGADSAKDGAAAPANDGKNQTKSQAKNETKNDSKNPDKSKTLAIEAPEPCR